MKHSYTVGLSASGINELLSAIQNYQRWLERKTEELCQRLAEYGVQIANIGFQGSIYDGSSGDWTVTIEDRGSLQKAVVARGATVLFIEFGTGVVYPDSHPEAAKNGMIRGTYGKGHGKQETWGFYGDDPGSNGVFATNKDGSMKEPSVILTHGNPANMPMYNAVKAVEFDFNRIVQEVFNSD